MRRAALLLLAIAVALAACAPARGPIRIGTKGFEEQAILARVLEGVVDRQGLRALIVECGDTYACYRAMRAGEVDLMVEYTGTALSLSGVLAPDPETAMAQIREVYREAGLAWFEPLGFDNAYTVVVPTARAAALELETIEDLTRLPGGVRVAAPPEYVRRPGDGLYPLLRRYGLRLADPPLLLADAGARYEALEQGRADVAIGYATDGALAGRRLRVLGDPLGFFPAYEGAVVARAEVLGRHADLAPALRRLEGRIDTAAMRALNARVQLEGASRTRVAGDLIRELGFPEERDTGVAGRPELVLVRHGADRLASEAARALRLADAAFPEHAVRTEEAADPVRALADGSARLAVLGAERFFVQEPGTAIPRRETAMEAVAVLGSRVLHLVRRRGDARPPLQGRIGLVPPGSGAARVSEWILGLSNARAALRAEPDALLRAVAERRLEVALILATPPDPAVAEALATHANLSLHATDTWLTPARAKRLPYLRPARIPAGTYPAQATPIGALSEQIVLAAPAARPGRASHVIGPAAALRSAGLPLDWSEVTALAEANATAEVPDPLLPSPWSLRQPAPARGADARAAEVVDTALNIAIAAFLIWLVYLLVRRQE